MNGINFSVEKGDVVGFLGPNGAGKSTTMKMLTGYLLPTSGTATVSDCDLFADPLAVRRNTGYLPENNPLYLEMYVREYLEFVARMYKVPKRKQRINEMIERTGLTLEVNKKLGALSKGYRQRVGLAQALLHDPPVLILDEPTSGLDPNQIVDIRNLIRELGREKTILLSTHIMQEVQAMCNRVIIINKGNLVADKPTEQLLHDYAGKAYVRAAFKKPVTRQELMQIAGVAEASEESGSWMLRSKSGKDIREEVFRFAAAKDNPLMELHAEGGSLEKIFQQLTDRQISPEPAKKQAK